MKTSVTKNNSKLELKFDFFVRKNDRRSLKVVQPLNTRQSFCTISRKCEISVLSVILACILSGSALMFSRISCRYRLFRLYRRVDVNAENREMSNDSFVVDGRYNRGRFVKVT